LRVEGTIWSSCEPRREGLFVLSNPFNEVLETRLRRAALLCVCVARKRKLGFLRIVTMIDCLVVLVVLVV